MKISVDHKVHAKNLKIMTFLLWINEKRTSTDRISCNSFHLRVNLSIKVILVSILLFQIFLKIVVTDFVAFLVLAILWQVFLNGVISEMNRCETIINCVLKRSCANIAKLIPVTFNDSINRADHHVMT